MKLCCHCRISKPLAEYRRACDRKDGLYQQCRSCQSVSAKASYQRHKAARCAGARSYKERNQALVTGKIKERYWRNRERELAHAKRWLKENPEKRKVYIRKWNNANREKVRAYQKRHKAHKRNAPVTDLTPRGWQLLQSTFRNRCVYCGKSTQLEQDHVTPVSKQGWHSVSNVVPACRSCNATKSNGPAPSFWWMTGVLDG